jgi:(2Fe-2S) ferredoxin
MSQSDEVVRKAVEKHGIGAYSRHVLLCTGPSCCTPEDGMKAWETLKHELKESGLGNACFRTKVGCLRICANGPAMVVYPEGTWYQSMTAERIPHFVKQHLVDGEPLEEQIIARNPLPKK